MDKDFVIDIKNLKKSFGANSVLRDINLQIEKGKTVVTIGKSGTGKSVLLKCIAGLLYPDSGTVMVLGKNVPDLTYDGLQELRKSIGFVFQGGALYDSMTVRENLKFPLQRHFKQSEKETLDKINEVLSDVGLLEAIDKMPAELSGGMRKRIGVARTVIMNPEIMLWDEPTTGLDPATTREISYLIRKMQDKYGVTSIVVTHDMVCTKIVSDSIAVLKDGEYAYKGSFDELSRSDDDFVKSFFE